MTDQLVEQVRPLLDEAIALYRDDPVGAELETARTRLDEPLRVAIAGKVKAGKSTLLNALVGEDLAPTDAGECTKIVTWYRHALGYDVPSDCAPVLAPVLALLDAGVDVHCLRDPTRGGLAAALATLARAAGATFTIDEERIPVDPAVRDACVFLGLDPLSLSNEGRFVAFVAAADAERAVEIAARVAPAGGTVRIGTVTGGGEPLVLLRRPRAATRVLPLRSGHGLPR